MISKNSLLLSNLLWPLTFSIFQQGNCNILKTFAQFACNGKTTKETAVFGSKHFANTEIGSAAFVGARAAGGRNYQGHSHNGAKLKSLKLKINKNIKKKHSKQCKSKFVFSLLRYINKET